MSSSPLCNKIHTSTFNIKLEYNSHFSSSLTQDIHHGIYYYEPKNWMCINEFDDMFFVSWDFTGSSDPYVKVKIGDKLHYKSKTIYRDLNPIWDESFVLPINDLSQTVIFKVSRVS